MDNGRMNTWRKDIRRHERMFLKVALRIEWRDAQGCTQSCLAHSVDASQGGLRLELTEYVPPRTLVFIKRKASHDTLSAATVRHCTRRGMKYFAGLELSQGDAAGIIESCAAPAC